MLENKFCWIPAISYFPGWVGGRAEMKLKLAQFNFNLNCLIKLSLAIYKIIYFHQEEDRAKDLVKFRFKHNEYYSVNGKS